MFRLAWKKQFWRPFLKWFNEKTKKCSLDVRKKREKLNFLSKMIFQLPTWRQIVQILVQCKSSTANRTISRPKSEIVSQSQHNVFVNVFLWTRKMHFWRLCCKIPTKLEKFVLKLHTKLKKKVFEKNKSSKSSRTFRMQFWQNWRKFFFRTKIRFRSNTKLNETWQSFAKNLRSSLDT